MDAIDRLSALPRLVNRVGKRRRHVDVEEVEDSLHISKRVAGSSSVRIVSLPYICALIKRYSRNYVLRMFAFVKGILKNVERT